MSASRSQEVLQLFVRHQARIKGFIVSLLPDFAAVEDVLQETFLVVQRRAEEFEPDSNFLAWAFRIARFQVMKAQQAHRRTSERFSDAVLESLAASAPTEPWDDRRLALLPACLHKLAPQARRIVELFYQGEHKPQEIAQLLSWTPAAVSVALSRAASSCASVSNEASKTFRRMNEEHLDQLIDAHLSGVLTVEQRELLESRLLHSAADRERFWQLAETHTLLHEALQERLGVETSGKRTRSKPHGSFWQPLTAAAAGLALGMFCTSVVLAYTQPKSPVIVTKPLPLADADFESGSPIPALGIPAEANVWSGDFSSVAVAENGITPKQGQRMLRFLRSNNELSPKNERSYVGSVAQVIDLRPLRAELSGADQLVEVSALFDSIAMPHSGLYEFAVKAAAYRADIADAPRLWEDHEASGSRSNRSVVADSDPGTWQRVAVPLVVPPDANFLVIECAVVFKGAQEEQGVAEFPGHYLDQAEVRLSSSGKAWAMAHRDD